MIDSAGNELQRREIEACRVWFQKTKNPLYAWWAYRACRRANLPLPSWLLAYLDAAADGVLALQLGLEDRSPKAEVRDPFDVGAAVAKALGFVLRARGRGTVLSDWAKDRRDFLLWLAADARIAAGHS